MRNELDVPRLAGPLRSLGDLRPSESAERQETSAAASVGQGPNDPPEYGAYSVRHCGHVGQEILDGDGRILVWTTNEAIAQLICSFFNEKETPLLKGLL